jgi:hypothetical protein
MLGSMKPSESPGIPVPNDAGRHAYLSGRVAAALMSDEALAPLAEPPAIARIDVLGAKLPETGS